VVPEEASWPNLLEVCWIRFKEKLGFQDHGGINPDCPQHGPYEASEGIYHGRTTKTGLGYDPLEVFELLTLRQFFRYHRFRIDPSQTSLITRQNFLYIETSNYPSYN